jgi:hypothetical protein
MILREKENQMNIIDQNPGPDLEYQENSENRIHHLKGRCIIILQQENHPI